MAMALREHASIEEVSVVGSAAHHGQSCPCVILNMCVYGTCVASYVRIIIMICDHSMISEV